MKKFLFIACLIIPSFSFADILGDLRSDADVLLTTQAVAGGYELEPSTVAIQVSTLTAPSGDSEIYISSRVQIGLFTDNSLNEDIMLRVGGSYMNALFGYNDRTPSEPVEIGFIGNFFSGDETPGAGLRYRPYATVIGGSGQTIVSGLDIFNSNDDAVFSISSNGDRVLHMFSTGTWKFFDGNNSNFVGLTVSSDVTHDSTYVLPVASGTVGQVLSIEAIYTSSVTLSWQDDDNSGGSGGGYDLEPATVPIQVSTLTAPSGDNDLQISTNVVITGNLNPSGGITDGTLASADFANADHGDFTYTSGSASLDTGVVSNNEINTSATPQMTRLTLFGNYGAGATGTGLDIDLNATGTGSSRIGIDIDVEGGTSINRAINITEGHLSVSADNTRIELGASQDSAIYYDGSDLVVDPRQAGSGGVNIGDGEAGADYVLRFNGETNDGTFTWMEDEDYLNFDKEIRVSTLTANDTLSLPAGSTAQFLGEFHDGTGPGTSGQVWTSNGDGSAPTWQGVTKAFSVTVSSPASGGWDSNTVAIGNPFPYAVTVTSVTACVLGTNTPTLDFNIEERSQITLNSAGTDMFASDQEADGDCIAITSFSNAGWASNAHFVFTTGASASSGDIEYVTLQIQYTVD